jgi:hypothetical protein
VIVVEGTEDECEKIDPFSIEGDGLRVVGGEMADTEAEIGSNAFARAEKDNR